MRSGPEPCRELSENTAVLAMKWSWTGLPHCLILLSYFVVLCSICCGVDARAIRRSRTGLTGLPGGPWTENGSGKDQGTKISVRSAIGGPFCTYSSQYLCSVFGFAMELFSSRVLPR